MENPELLELTASERLTLDQEYANQISWSTDPTKYCFIIHSRKPVMRYVARNPGSGVQTPFGIDYTLDNPQQAEEMKQPVDVNWVEENEEEGEEDSVDTNGTAHDKKVEEERSTDGSSTEQTAAADSSATATAASAVNTAAAAAGTEGTVDTQATSISQPDPGSRWPLTPIGDVNLFLHADFNLSDYGIHGGGCELEIMIAREEYRGRGLATEAIQAIMRFSERKLGVSRFVAKVLKSNTASVALFEKKLGFELIEYVECFEECVYYKDTSIGAEEEDSDAEETTEGKDAAAPVSTTQTSEDQRVTSEDILSNAVEQASLNDS
jgi:ribosomal protein S18 acetylase RimI-like enzyme